MTFSGVRFAYVVSWTTPEGRGFRVPGFQVLFGKALSSEMALGSLHRPLLLLPPSESLGYGLYLDKNGVSAVFSSESYTAVFCEGFFTV